MANNKTFYKKATDGKFTLGDIFSEAGRRHKPQDAARVFIAGTELTTPAESQMLATWQKPFLFAKFFGFGLLFLGLCYLLYFIHIPSAQFLMLGTCAIVPLTLLLLTWEMNIPRNISLCEVLRIFFLGGILSIIITILLDYTFPSEDAVTAIRFAGPILEELAKLIVVYVIISRKDYRFILNGILIGMAVGAGFAVFENIQYAFFSPMQEVEVFAADLLSEGYSLVGCILGNGISTALARAATSIASHGMFAALYGGALIAAREHEPVGLSCLKKGVFLKYFCFAILLHMLNNSGIIELIYVEIFPRADSQTVFTVVFGLVMGTIGTLVFLPLLRQGVNQVVEYVKAMNDGSLTNAVQNPCAEPVPVAVGAAASHDDTPAVGAPVKASGKKGGFIKFVSGPDTGKTYSFPEEREVIIGRSGQCEVALPNNSNVSSIHCSVRVTRDAMIITDKNSTNGTVVGTRRLQPNVPTAVPDDVIVYLGTKGCAFRFTRLR